MSTPEATKIWELKERLQTTKDLIWHLELSWGHDYRWKEAQSRKNSIIEELRVLGVRAC